MTSASIATSTAHRWRASMLGAALTVALTCAAAAAGRQVIQVWPAVAGRPALTPADAVPIVTWAALAAALLWAAMLVLLAAMKLLPSQHAAVPTNVHLQGRPAPAVLRVAALLLLLTGTMCGQSGALAAPAPVAVVQHDRSAQTRQPTSLDSALPDPSFGQEPTTDCADTRSLPSPGWAPPPPKPIDQCAVASTPLITGSTHDVDATVVVHRGDSLWSLVARHLGTDADPATIAQVWPTWYAANRAVIGADPNRMLPGEVLQVPGTEVGAP